jgi:hypothetical protein
MRAFHKIVTQKRARTSTIRVQERRALEFARPEALVRRRRYRHEADTKVANPVHGIDRKLAEASCGGGCGRPMRQLRCAAGERPALLPGVWRAMRSHE